MPSRKYRLFSPIYRCPECGKMYFYGYPEGHRRITCPYCAFTTTKSYAMALAKKGRRRD